MIKKINQRLSRLLEIACNRIQRRINDSANTRILRNLKSVGHGVRINGRITASGLRNIEVHDNVHIGNNAFIRGEGGLVIGANTHISRNLVLYTINHDFHGRCLPYDDNQIEKPVVIGKNVWIGMNVCIAPGTQIGDGAIIGMGCTVFGDVPAKAIIGNQKWRVLGNRDDEHYERLESQQLYGGANGIPVQNDR